MRTTGDSYAIRRTGGIYSWLDARYGRRIYRATASNGHAIVEMVVVKPLRHFRRHNKRKIPYTRFSRAMRWFTHAAARVG